MIWFLSFVIAALLLAGWQMRRRSRRHWAHLEAVAADVAANRSPQNLVFYQSPRFTKIALALDELGHERKALRSRAAEAESNLQAIISGLDEGIAVVDRHHAIQMTNPSLRRLFSLKNHPAGQTVLGALREPAVEEIIGAALASGGSQSKEITLPALAGRPELTIASYAVPVLNGGDDVAALAVFRDVTRLKQLEEMRREFVANVSHELRTPLAIFHGYLENLLEEPNLPSDEVFPILQILRKHSLRLNALVQDLLTITRLESQREQLEFAPLELAPLLRETGADWTPRMAQKGITLHVDAPTGIPPLVMDRPRLEQVLNNLLDNALNHSASGQQIWLRAQACGPEVELRVEDNGCGIPPADLPHIFERFYRADKARSRDQGGTGLGLSIVKHIVQAHGGTVSAQSVLERGTSIILRLPFAGPGERPAR